MSDEELKKDEENTLANCEMTGPVTGELSAKIVPSMKNTSPDRQFKRAYPTISKTQRISTPTIGSLFSGCGGLDLGFVWAGAKISWANDFSHAACETYRHYFGDHIFEGPIEDLNINKLPKVDIVMGGFPCQDFSVIWKRPGLEGKRGSLYSYLVNAVKVQKPKIFLGENVKGLCSIAGGKAIRQIINDFDSLGYDVTTNVYNFADYGAPQLRERVLIIGVRRDLGFKFVKIPKTHEKHVNAKEALKGVEKVPFNNEHQNVTERTKKLLSLIPPGGNFTSIPKHSPYYVNGMISHVYRRLHPNEPSKTIIAAGGGGTWGYHYKENRSLTNRERARLFGFPDDMFFHGSIAEVRRQIGNSVPPIGIMPIAKELVALLRGEPQFMHDVLVTAKDGQNFSVDKKLALVGS